MDSQKSDTPGQATKRMLGAAAFGMVLLCFVIITLKSDLNADAKSIVMLVIGRFIGYIDAIYGYEFGSSRKEQASNAAPPALSPEAAKEVVR